MQVAEIFYSIQGEGRLVGMPSVFIRTSGCNLRCVWCDTPYTSWAPQGRKWSVEEILQKLAEYRNRHIVVTGGEPLLAADIEELTAQLKHFGSHITIETAATLFKPVHCDLVSMSPKLANSIPWRRARGQFAKMHDNRRLNFRVMQQFIDRYDYQLKFVVDQRDDFDEVAKILEKLKNVDCSRVLIMGQGKTAKELRDKTKWIIELCKTYGYGYTPRLHIELFGNRRGA